MSAEKFYRYPKPSGVTRWADMTRYLESGDDTSFSVSLDFELDLGFCLMVSCGINQSSIEPHVGVLI